MTAYNPWLQRPYGIGRGPTNMGGVILDTNSTMNADEQPPYTLDYGRAFAAHPLIGLATMAGDIMLRNYHQRGLEKAKNEGMQVLGGVLYGDGQNPQLPQTQAPMGAGQGGLSAGPAAGYPQQMQQQMQNYPAAPGAAGPQGVMQQLDRQYSVSSNPVSDRREVEKITNRVEQGMNQIANMDNFNKELFRQQMLDQLTKQGRTMAQRQQAWRAIEPIIDAKQAQWNNAMWQQASDSYLANITRAAAGGDMEAAVNARKDLQTMMRYNPAATVATTKGDPTLADLARLRNQITLAGMRAAGGYGGGSYGRRGTGKSNYGGGAFHVDGVPFNPVVIQGFEDRAKYLGQEIASVSKEIEGLTLRSSNADGSANVDAAKKIEELQARLDSLNKQRAQVFTAIDMYNRVQTGEEHTDEEKYIDTLLRNNADAEMASLPPPRLPWQKE